MPVLREFQTAIGQNPPLPPTCCLKVNQQWFLGIGGYQCGPIGCARQLMAEELGPVSCYSAVAHWVTVNC